MAIDKRFKTGRNRYITKRDIFTYASLAVLIFISAVLQTSCLTFFKMSAALTLATVCAVGFLGGDKVGAVTGICGGILVDILGGTGFSLNPILYMLCGYLCGAIVGWFLSENLPSFLVFSALAGVIREIFTVIHYGLVSPDFSLGKILIKPVLLEYLAYILCVVPAYLAVKGIYFLFRKRQNGAKRMR